MISVEGKGGEPLDARGVAADEGVDCRIIGECQAAVAEAVSVFGKIDVLFCCSSEGSSLTARFPCRIPFTSRRDVLTEGP